MGFEASREACELHMIDIRKHLSVALDILELPPEDVRFLESLTYGDLADGLVKFKKLVRRRRKALARRYHPDVTGDDGEKMKRINDAVDFVMGMKVIRRPAPVRFTYSPTNASASASFTATFSADIF